MQTLILPAITVAFGLYLFGIGCGVKWLPPKFLRGRVWVAIIGVFVLLWGGSSVITAMNRPSAAQLVADQINQQIRPPAPLDQSLRIDSVTAQGNTVIYTLSFTEEHTDPKAMEQSVRNDMKNNACGNQDYQAIFRMQGSLQMVFKDMNGNVVDTLTVSPADCGVTAQ